MTFRERVKDGILVFDGAMGTMLQRHLAPGELPELLNLTQPTAVAEVHLAYLRAGADVIETNTLNANRLKMEKAGHTVEEVVSAAVLCAKNACAESGKNCFIALSMGSLGVMIEPFGALGFADAYDLYAEMAQAGERAGADLILIETVSDLLEMKAALLAARRATNLPVAATLTFFANGKLLTGADVLTSVAVAEALGADVVGLNCGLGAKQMRELADELTAAASVPILINPNAGLPKLIDGKSVYAELPDAFSLDALALVEQGARLIGGCCGTTPEHIAALARTVRGVVPKDICKKDRCVIASGSKSVEFGADIVEIADVTGADIDETIDNALEAEADMLRVALSPLAEAILPLQEVVLKPLYLIADSPADAEKALWRYNGKPLIGVAHACDVEEYTRIAHRGGAALAVSDEACFRNAAAVLGAKNVFVDCGADAQLSGALTEKGIRTILRGAGTAAARVSPA